jgi:outer membrane protein OmpU
MNKLKKIGLSALAGTLASLSAQAGEMSVSGTAELSYVQRHENETTGNPLGQKKNISFAGSGELDNGWTVSILHVMNDTFTGQSSSSMTIGMGSLGSLSIDGGTGGYGLAAIDNVVPIAFEEADYGMATGLIDVGSVVDNQSSLHWKLPELYSGLALQASYQPRGGSGAVADGGTGGEVGSAAFKNAYSITAQFSPEMLPGLKVGGGWGENDDGGTTHGKDREEQTYFATYAFGPLSVGYQWSEDEDTGSTVYTTDIYGASFNINDVFSVSYQYGETDYDKTGTDVTAEFEGISAAYNIGPMAIKLTHNDGKNVGGTTGVSDENRELNLSMAF